MMEHFGVVDEEELEHVCSERETALDRNASWPDNPRSDLRFVKKFTRPDFSAKNFTH